MLNFEQQAAFDAIVKGSGNVLLTGNAGTGKSFVLKQAIQALQAQDQGVMVCATTGVASTLIGGKTVHSALGINPFGNVKSNFSSMMNKFENISQADLIVIDEVSMMSPDLLDQIDHIFRKMFEHHKPFGGMRFVFVGDFLQLPPVEKNGPPKFVFESEAWASAQVQVMQLVTVVRQQDKTFANFLANIRQAISTPSTLAVIKSRMGLIPDKPVTRFVPTNAEADEINISSLAALEGESKVFVANDKNPNKYNPSSSSWVEDIEYWDKNCLAPKKLELKVGARVICLKNSSNVLSLGLVNGDTGTVTRLGSDQITVSWDRFYGEEEAVTVTKFAQDDGSNWKTTKGFREQFPLKLAYAITIHKSQGMTIPSARIALGKAFAEGQIYVALSRVQTLEGLYIDSYSPQALKASVKALKFYNLPGNVTGQEAIAISYMDEIAQQPEEAIMKEVTINTGKVYAGSGSRSLKLDQEMFNKVFTRLVEMIRQSKPSMLITGMAEGFDEVLALAAMATQTPLKAMIPFKGFGNHYWGKKTVSGQSRLTEYKQILAYAQSTGGVEYICSDWNGPDGRSAMIHRNEAMANACDKAWIYNPVTPGTKRFKEYCDANKVWYYIIKIDGEGPGDTPQIPTPQGPKEDNMKTYLITYTDGTEEIIVTDKRISELAEELKAAGKGCSIKPYKEGIVNTPQIEEIKASIQEAIEPKEEPMKQATPEAALIKRESLSAETQEWLVSILENEIAPMLVKDVSSYAPGRMRTWMPYEAPLDTTANKGKPFVPGVLHDQLWQFIVDLCHKHGMRAQTCLISRGGNIKPHRDTTYADAWAMGINLGACNWHISSTREGAKPDFTMDLTGGEVFSFNSKHVHAVTDAAPDRWAINVWAIANTKAAREAQIHERITQMFEDNPQVAEFVDHHQPGAGETIKEEGIVNTPQVQAVQEVIQDVIEPKEEIMNIYHWLEQSDIVDKLGNHVVSGQKDAEMVMMITNNPTPDRKQAFQSALMGTGSATYTQVAGNDLWLAPINSGTWGFHYLERLNKKGIKFSIAIRRLDLMKEFWDENPKTVTQVGEHLVNLANLSWVDGKNLYLLDIDGVPPGGQFNWDLIGIEANDAKKLTKRMAEIVRLSKSASSDNLRVLALSPENNTNDPGFWVKVYDGKNAIRFSALPEDMRQSLKKKGHLHLMGRGFTKVDINGVMTKVLVKGDFVVVPDYMWTWKDVDVVAHAENLKTEVTLKDPAEDDLWTFWEHAPLHVTTWDQQTMLNYPQLLTVARMREDYLAEMNGIDAQLAKGLLPGQVEDNHQIQGEEEAHDEFKKLLPKAEEIRKNRDLATKIRDAGFDIRMFENLIGFAVRGYAESKARFKHVPEFDMNGNPGALNDKHDKHVVVMRNSFRATCVTDAFLNEFVGIPYPAKRIAFFDSTVGMVWNAEHFARTFELHGTHDNDDTHYFVPIKVWSSDKKTVPTLKKHGVILPGMQVPSTAQNAKMVLLVLRLPNGAGEYSIMEFDFATWPKEISFDESLVETHDLSFSSGWVSPQPMVMPGNMPGLPTSRVYSKTSYTKADLMTDMDAQFVNPGFGTMCNALVSYSSITGGGIPACMTDSLGNIVDATQQGADIASFQAIELLLADIKSELVAMGRNNHLEMNEYFYLRRGAVAKKATKAGVMSVRKGEIETFDTEYTKVYNNLKNNVKYKYSFQMRSQVPINQRILNMQFTKAELDWCKDFVLEIEKNIDEADKAPTGVVVSKFTKPLHQAILRERRQVIVDAAIAKMESMKDVNKAMLCLWHTILKPDFISKDAKYGYMDRVMCQMGSERALAHLLIDAIVDMEDKRKSKVGATKIVLTNNKMVNGAFVNHVVKPLQADRATQIPVDIISDIIGKIPQGFNFVWVMAEDKPLAVFKRQNSTFVEIIVDLPQTIKV